ncbi:MAG: hypothetical protein HQ504_02340 [Rhodospirillaceae bacterium]|nr:hypothetical protein [Rhodospirillaceae bacterium]
MARSSPPPPSAERTPESPIDVDRIDRNIRESLRKQVIALIDKHPEIALAVIRGWSEGSHS